MKKKILSQGFTLIELLVVITIIAVLASIAFPVYNKVTMRSKITKDISGIRQILMACKMYGIDNDGIFPTGASDTSGGAGDSGTNVGSTSTAVFNELIPDYVNEEKIFYTAGNLPTLKRIPDENGDLTANENCFSYVIGVTDSSNSNIPVVADWFTGGSTSYDEKHPWWGAGQAVVGRADGSCKSERIDKEGGGYVKAADKRSDLFTAPTTGSQGGSGSAGLVPTTMTLVHPQ